ncbi:hypothetical protein [Methylobacterium sp. NFXW15]|uniref:hypothetical protein n=1 Tax=Methylobacterium sp. NFXW15 TaxID=2819512 RepID=UPI003CEB7C34
MTRILFALAALSLATPSLAAPTLSVAECSTRFFAAQRDGSLNGRDWESFRQTVCETATDAARSSVRRASELREPTGSSR